MALPNVTELPLTESLKLEPMNFAHQPEPPSELSLTAVRSNSNSKKSHDEMHSDYGDVIRDLIIGFADGLTVPFALTAGLSS